MKNTPTSLIHSELQNIQETYNTPIKIVDGLNFSQKDLIRTIEFYSNSKYLNGQTDELNKDKPFYNIINAMCDVEDAAKDIDTKDIQATSDDGEHYIEAFLLAKDVYEWMKATNFAQTLNDMRRVHTRYGSLLIKKCIERDSDGNKVLKIEVPEWKNLIVDQTDILGGPIVERHYMSIRKILAKKAWNENKKKELISKIQKTGTTHKVCVYEIRGYFPVSFIKELDEKVITEVDKITYTYQLYYLASPSGDIETGEQGGGTAAATIPLYWEDNTDQVYKYLARKKKAGRDFGVGVSEEGEEAQVWTNDAILKQFGAMEYTTKVIGQTASKKLKGRNLINETDNGTILEHEDGKPITPLQLLPAGGLGQYTVLINQWFTQFERATSAYAAQRGESPSSRTAAKLQAAVLQQSGSVMENIREDFGIFLTELFTDWIMPYLSKKLNAKHILSHEFSLAELQEIDNNFSVHYANEQAKEMLLSGRRFTAEDYSKFQAEAKDKIRRTKSVRFLEVPKDYYINTKAKITFNVTGEQQDKQGVNGVLLEIMKIYASNPGLIFDPILTEIFMKIVSNSGSGISPAKITAAIQARAAEAEKNNEPVSKISQSINFKDLPPDGKVQMAAKAGIQINTPPAEDAMSVAMSEGAMSNGTPGPVQ